MLTNASATVRAEPNVTPMIDVMLVLLIIFMVVIPSLLTGVAAEPPLATNLRARPEEAADQTLGIDAAGRYYLNREPIANAALGERLRSIYLGEREDRVLYLAADKRLEYREVLEAIEVASRSGVRVVGMVGTLRPKVSQASRP